MRSYLRKIYFISALILGGILFMHLLSGADAVYRSGGSGSASARVADFSVRTTTPVLQSGDSVLDCNLSGDSVVYCFDVENDSELSVEYGTEFSGLPESIRAETAQGSGSLFPGESRTVCVTFWAVDESDRTQETDLSGVSILVRAVQKEAICE